MLFLLKTKVDWPADYGSHVLIAQHSHEKTLRMLAASCTRNCVEETLLKGLTFLKKKKVKCSLQGWTTTDVQSELGKWLLIFLQVLMQCSMYTFPSLLFFQVLFVLGETFCLHHCSLLLKCFGLQYQTSSPTRSFTFNIFAFQKLIGQAY